jgi:hypothetical protein
MEALMTIREIDAVVEQTAAAFERTMRATTGRTPLPAASERLVEFLYDLVAYPMTCGLCDGLGLGSIDCPACGR